MDESPPVVSDLANIEPGTQLLDEGLDRGVVHHVALSGLQEALLMPGVVGHVIAGDSQRQVVFGDPKPRRDHILTLIITSLGGNTSTNAVMSVVEARSSPP